MITKMWMNLFSFSIYRLFILVVTSCLLLLTGCASPTKQDVMNELMPTREEKYAIHLFYKNSLPKSETMELNIFHNSHPAITNAINKVQFWDQYQERNIKWAKALGIKEFPMYLVIDADGVVLATPFLSNVKKFLTESLLQK